MVFPDEGDFGGVHLGRRAAGRRWASAGMAATEAGDPGWPEGGCRPGGGPQRTLPKHDARPREASLGSVGVPCIRHANTGAEKGKGERDRILTMLNVLIAQS